MNNMVSKILQEGLWWEEREVNADWEKIKDTFRHAGSTHHRTQPTAYLYSMVYL